MGKRGRPTKPRNGDLGLYIEKLRVDLGWSMQRLANEAGISHKTLSKIELGLITPRRPGILLQLAGALGVYPDRLLLLASLTPMLRPIMEDVSVISNKRKTLSLLVNDEERRQLENYLQFLRYTASVEILYKKTKSEIEM